MLILWLTPEIFIFFFFFKKAMKQIVYVFVGMKLFCLVQPWQQRTYRFRNMQHIAFKKEVKEVAVFLVTSKSVLVK